MDDPAGEKRFWKMKILTINRTRFLLERHSLPMNRVESEARSSPENELALTPALSPRRGRIIFRWLETTGDNFGSLGRCAPNFFP
jgi:hypothetical protein